MRGCAEGHGSAHAAVRPVSDRCWIVPAWLLGSKYRLRSIGASPLQWGTGNRRHSADRAVVQAGSIVWGRSCNECSPTPPTLAHGRRHFPHQRPRVMTEGAHA
jgi:hypothetical protein